MSKKSPIKAKGCCPNCGGRNVTLKHGFCWRCNDCKATITRDYKADKLGSWIHTKKFTQSFNEDGGKHYNTHG